MIKCPECGFINLDASKPCSDCGLDLIDALRRMPDEEKQKLYVKGSPREPVIKGVQKVIIKDFDMPFGSMILFMFKWGLAAIPAIIMLTALVVFALLLITGALTSVSK